MSATLKELLKPPFSHEGSNRVGDKDSWLIYLSGELCQHGDLFDEFLDFVCQALNNEYQRVYGKPKRWMLGKYEHKDSYNPDTNYVHCPLCHDYYGHCYNHCPSCGVKLDPWRAE